MSNIIDKHLEGVTVDNMLNFKGEAFTLYASARGVQLGFTGYGQFTVKADGKQYDFNNPAVAIEKYSELVKA